MQIDRTRFLLLVGTIAGGCGGPRVRHDGSASNVGATEATTTAAPTATQDPSKDLTMSPSHEGATTSPTSEGYWPAPMPTNEGGTNPPPTGEGYVGPVYTPTKKKPFNVQACSGDDIGKAYGCASLKIDKSCAPFPFINQACDDAMKNFKGRIAERAVGCIRSKKPMDLCDAMSVYDCKDAALRSACRDPKADTACAQILQSCPGTSMDECRGYLSGMNDTGRAKMLQCMQANCTYGLYSCTEGI